MFGSGPVRGFAVVHCLGILTSMFSAILVSRMLVNLIYGEAPKGRSLSIGQVWKPEGTADGNAQETRRIMEFFRIKKDIPSCATRWCSTSSRCSPSCSRCSSWPPAGLHLSVEFTGGTLVEVSYAEAPQLEPIRERAGPGSGYRRPGAELRQFRDVLIRLPNREDRRQDRGQREGDEHAQQADGPAPELRRVGVRRPAGRQGARRRRRRWRCCW